MEQIKILCCEKSNGKIDNLNELLSIMKAELEMSILDSHFVCKADFISEELEAEDEQYDELHVPFEASVCFKYKNMDFKLKIEKGTKYGKCSWTLHIIWETEDIIEAHGDSVFYEYKENLLKLLNKKFDKIFWLYDSQNTRFAADLYIKIHEVENMLRGIINRYMAIKYGGNWFETYTYEDYMDKYKIYNKWFLSSKYDLFKRIDNHLYNLEIGDIFRLLKTAKKKQIDRVVKTAIENIVKHEKDKASDYINSDILEAPSLWEEERFDGVFSEEIVEKWQDDFSKRRNMIAHNKMICKDLYFDTIAEIQFYKEEFLKAEKVLLSYVKPSELIEAEHLLKQEEIAMNLEYCDICSELPDEQEIVDKLNETDDFMDLFWIIDEAIPNMKSKIEDLLAYIDDVESHFHVDNFFDEDNFTEAKLLEEYIDFFAGHGHYCVWKRLIEKDFNSDIFELIENEIQEGFCNLKNELLYISESISYADLSCFSEGKQLQIVDFDGNKYVLQARGWLCPERGHTDEISIELICNGEIIDYGEIWISYGDYEMSEDGIPMPYAEDGMVVKFSTVNKKLIAVTDEIMNRLNKIEDQIMKIEI